SGIDALYRSSRASASSVAEGQLPGVVAYRHFRPLPVIHESRLRRAFLKLARSPVRRVGPAAGQVLANIDTAQQLAFQEYLHAINEASARVARLEQHLRQRLDCLTVTVTATVGLEW